jgi:hypothetical protein
MSCSGGLRPEDIVNLEAYPIADRDAPPSAASARAAPARDALVERLRSELDSNQYCVLPAFMQRAAREQAVAEAMAARHMAHHIRDRRNCYLQRDLDPSLPEDHPRNLLFETSSRMIAYDRIPADSPLKTLYHWAATRRLVADIVGAEALYDNADPYQPANLLCFEDGDRSSWHFDSGNAFTVTLMLQAPEAGGAFEMVPNARSDRDPNHGYLRAVLQGERSQDIVEVAREPGSLCIFRGCNSLHRVSPVAGGALRVMGVLVYETEPGVVGDPVVNETVYGPRAAMTG